MRAGRGEAIQGQTTRRSYPPPRFFLNSRGHGGERWAEAAVEASPLPLF